MYTRLSSLTGLLCHLYILLLVKTLSNMQHYTIMVLPSVYCYTLSGESAERHYSWWPILDRRGHLTWSSFVTSFIHLQINRGWVAKLQLGCVHYNPGLLCYSLTLKETAYYGGFAMVGFAMYLFLKLSALRCHSVTVDSQAESLVDLQLQHLFLS